MTTDNVERELELPEERTQTCLFTVTEEEVVRRLGINKENVEYLRIQYLTAAEDFMTISGRLLYAEDGIRKMNDGIIEENAHAGVAPGDLALPQVQVRKESADAATVILDAEVIEIFHKNTQYLRALLGGRKITVRVRNNANFIAQSTDGKGNVMQHGTIIPSRELAMKSQDLFDFIGRYPRARGRR